MTPLRFAHLGLLLVLACGRADPKVERVEDSGAVGLAPRVARAFPAVGLAVIDTLSRWCAAFPNSAPALAVGTAVTIIFVESVDVPSRRAVVANVRDAECPATFAQSRWIDYRAYDLGLVDSLRPDDVPLATLAVAGDASWKRGPDNIVRADLDGDGVMEEARVCRAHEGHHFTVWSGSGAERRRRAHEYYDWGALVDPTCSAEESAEPSDSGAS